MTIKIALGAVVTIKIALRECLIACWILLKTTFVLKLKLLKLELEGRVSPLVMSTRSEAAAF